MTTSPVPTDTEVIASGVSPKTSPNAPTDITATADCAQRRKTEHDLIIGLLRLGMGHGIDMFSMLCLHHLEDGQFGVYNEPSDGTEVQEWLFDDVEKAVDFFIAKRHELRLGYDHEYGTKFYQEKAGVK